MTGYTWNSLYGTCESNGTSSSGGTGTSSSSGSDTSSSSGGSSCSCFTSESEYDAFHDGPFFCYNHDGVCNGQNNCISGGDHYRYGYVGSCTCKAETVIGKKGYTARSPIYQYFLTAAGKEGEKETPCSVGPEYFKFFNNSKYLSETEALNACQNFCNNVNSVVKVTGHLKVGRCLSGLKLYAAWCPDQILRDYGISAE